MLMRSNYKLPFSQFVKKAHKPLQLAVEDAVEQISDNPEIGEAKVGDLLGSRVYKFRFNRQEYLVAYRRPSEDMRRQAFVETELPVIDFYLVGSHENFYRELKRYLQSEV